MGYQTTREAIEVSEDPVWFSHANPMALREHCRNKTDEQVKALVAKGGVVGVNVFPPFLKRGYDSTLEDALEVVDYWAQVAGIDHVSIGLDYTEKQFEEWFHWLMAGKHRSVWPLTLALKLPEGIRRADGMPNLTQGLISRGYSEDDVQKIMGLNVLRRFQRIWKE